MFQTRPSLRLRVDQQPNRTVLHLTGRLDSHAAAEFKKAFVGVVGLESHVIDVDLRDVTGVDGLGLASLVWAWRTANAAGDELRVTQMGPKVRELIEQLNLHLLLRIVEERASA
jgi:anti-sigma B factor antagonist